jgi:Ca-activated chloride channel family protein
MGRRGRASVLAAFFAACVFTARPGGLCSSAGAFAAAAQAKISVTTEAVVVPVRVTDGRGNCVRGLTQDDFRVYENGKPQKIAFFQDTDTPITAGLIVDHSGSMLPKLRQVAAAVYELAHTSNAQDEMFVVNFSDDVSLPSLDGKPFTNDAQALDNAVAAASAAGQTALYDAIVEGLRHLQLGTLNKKALVIVSDGGDDASKHKYAEVLNLARQSQAVIYAIGLVGESHEEENPGLLRRLAKDTGGLAFFPHSVESVLDISKQIAADLREQYTLGYVPEGRAGAASFRKIAVKITAPGGGRWLVRTRMGYSRPAERDASGAPGETAP